MSKECRCFSCSGWCFLVKNKGNFCQKFHRSPVHITFIRYQIDHLFIGLIMYFMSAISRRFKCCNLSLSFLDKMKCVSQMPIVLVPLHFDRDPRMRLPSCQRSIVIRTFVTNDFMTGIPATPGKEIPEKVNLYCPTCHSTYFIGFIWLYSVIILNILNEFTLVISRLVYKLCMVHKFASIRYYFAVICASSP